LTIGWENVQKNFNVSPMKLKSRLVSALPGFRACIVIRQVAAGVFGVMLLLAGCSTMPLPPADLSEPGWTVQQGQAVWRQKKESPEIAGELLLATNHNGRTFLQFTKTPFPFVIAQTTSESWQLEIPTQDKKYSHRGNPPKRVIWFHLAPALNGIALEKPWLFEKKAENWRLENTKTGEMIEGFLNP
jgi:hypothetical protein